MCMVLKLYTLKEKGDLSYSQLGDWLIGFHSLVLLFFIFIFIYFYKSAKLTIFSQ